MKKNDLFQTSTTLTASDALTLTGDSAAENLDSANHSYSSNPRFLDSVITDSNHFLERLRARNISTEYPISQLNPDGWGGNPERESSRRDALVSVFHLMDPISPESVEPLSTFSSSDQLLWESGAPRMRGSLQNVFDGIGDLTSLLRQDSFNRLRPFVHSMQIERNNLMEGRIFSIGSADPHPVLQSFFELFPERLLHSILTLVELMPSGLWMPFSMAVFRLLSPIVYFIFNRQTIRYRDLYRVLMHTLNIVILNLRESARRALSQINSFNIVRESFRAVSASWSESIARGARSFRGFFGSNTMYVVLTGTVSLTAFLLYRFPQVRSVVGNVLFEVFVRPYNSTLWSFVRSGSAALASSQDSSSESAVAASSNFAVRLLTLFNKFGAEFFEFMAVEFRGKKRK